MVQVQGLKRPLTVSDIALAAIAGFFLAFAAFFFATLFPADLLFQAQLLVREPTPYAAVNVAVMNEQFQAATAALGSFWWWTAVMITGAFVTLWLLRCLRG